jgi:ADP-heptose:LPS heptosyltransferase
VRLLVAERDLGLGDLLTGIPALRALARAYPDHRRVLVASRAFQPLIDLAGVGFELCARIPERADVAVNLHGKGPESTARLQATRPGRLIAFGDDWRADEHEIARWCRLLEEHGIAADPDDLDIESPVPRGDAVVIHPGAASGARRWPIDRWAEVAASLPAPVVVTGSERERALAGRIPNVRHRAGETNLAELAELIAAARLVLCGDTGVAHLATAFGTPSVVLFGPTPPREWGPPPGRAQHVALWAGRRGDPHADAPDPGLLELTVPDVIAAASRLLAGIAASCP